MQPRNARACLASLHDFDFQILILQIALLLMFPLRGLAQADSAQEPEKATAESDAKNGDCFGRASRARPSTG